MKIIRQNRRPDDLTPVTWRDLTNQLFDDNFWDPFGNTTPRRALMMPRIDVTENKQEVVVKADIPGYDPAKVEVDITSDAIILHGKAEETKEDKDEETMFHRRERYYGEFYREIPLPAEVDSNKAKCTAKDGTLKITAPKKSETTKKTLKVEKE